jgi:hypothetical protein
MSPDGHKLERHFNLEADGHGKLVLEEELDAPMSGTLLGFSVQLQTGHQGRSHPTSLDVKSIRGGGTSLSRTITLQDHEEHETALTFRVQRGNRYLIRLISEGFEPGESVSGYVTARVKLG